MTEFSTMGLPDQVLARLADMGLKDPTPIQARAIPHALNGEDVLGLAQTGTGKTAAFGVPLISRMLDYGRKPAAKVTQSVHFIAKAEKLSLLKELLTEHKDERTLVFGRTKHGMEKLMRVLDKAGFAAAAIHGNKSQGQRERALAAFKSGEIKVLVATDVAARGLDIPDVKYVYNYELPNVPDAYVHRIGRTARAGKDGQAVAFCAPDEMEELKAIQKTMKITIPVASGRPWEALPDPAAPKGRRGGPGGGGKPGGRPGGNRRRRGGGGGRGGPGQSSGQGGAQGAGQGGGQRRRSS